MPLTVTVDLEHIEVFLRKTDRVDQILERFAIFTQNWNRKTHTRPDKQKKAMSSCKANPWPLLYKESRLPTALLLVPLSLQSAKGALPFVRPQGWVIQYVAQITQSPVNRLYVYSLCFPLNLLPEAQVLIWSFPFLPNSSCIFLTTLIVQESFC